MPPALVDRVLEQGRAAHPGTEVDREALTAYLLRRPGDAPAPSDEIAADLYLACACVSGDERALRIFDDTLLVLVPQFVARIESDPEAQSEIQQQLRDHLLVQRPDRAAKLRDYLGRGRLASWLRVVAIRAALDRRRSIRPTADLDAASEALASSDPELGYLEARYRQQFQDAFRAALSTLDDRDRTVLRLHLVDELSIDRIGQLFDVHRATAARWLAVARDQLFEGTRAHLRAELGASDEEFASLVRLVRSHLDVSVCRLLAEGSDEPSSLG